MALVVNTMAASQILVRTRGNVLKTATSSSVNAQLVTMGTSASIHAQPVAMAAIAVVCAFVPSMAAVTSLVANATATRVIMVYTVRRSAPMVTMVTTVVRNVSAEVDPFATRLTECVTVLQVMPSAISKLVTPITNSFC